MHINISLVFDQSLAGVKEGINRQWVACVSFSCNSCSFATIMALLILNKKTEHFFDVTQPQPKPPF